MDPGEDDPDDPDDFDDFAATQLDDDAYAAFLAREFDAEGRLQDRPPVGRWIAITVAVLVILAVWFLA